MAGTVSYLVRKNYFEAVLNEPVGQKGELLSLKNFSTPPNQLKKTKHELLQTKRKIPSKFPGMEEGRGGNVGGTLHSSLPADGGKNVIGQFQ